MRSRLSAVLDLLFAPRCPACDAPGQGMCPTCAGSLYELGPACPRCAEPVDGPVAVTCARCRRAPPPFAAAFAAYRYGGELAVALRRLKYQGRRSIARDLAPLIAPALCRAAAGADLAVPVPLHWQRLARRGFNQAAALLAHAGRGLAIPVSKVALRRIRATAPQSGLDLHRRARNVASAFGVPARHRAAIAGKRVLLFDDIMTTGATMAACSRALLGAGAASVVAFSAARAET